MTLKIMQVLCEVLAARDIEPADISVKQHRDQVDHYAIAVSMFSRGQLIGIRFEILNVGVAANPYSYILRHCDRYTAQLSERIDKMCPDCAMPGNTPGFMPIERQIELGLGFPKDIPRCEKCKGNGKI